MEKPMLWRIFAASLMISPIQGTICIETRCQSNNNQYRTCTVGGLPEYAQITKVSVKKERGNSSACEFGVSYGFIDHVIWTDKGCRGDFTVCYKNVTMTTEPTTSSPTESSLSPLEPDQKSNSAGVIGGIIAGFVVITIVLGVTVFLFRRHHIHIPCTCLTDKPSPLPDDFADPDYNYGEYAVVNPSTTATQSASSERTTKNVTYDSLSPDRDQHHYRGFYGQTNQNNGNKIDNEHSYMVVYDSFESDQQTSGNGLSNAAYYDEIATKGSQNVETDDAEKNEKYKEDDQCYYNVKAGPGSTGPEIVYHKYAVLDPDVTGYNRQGQDCQENKYIAKSESSSTEFVRRQNAMPTLDGTT